MIFYEKSLTTQTRSSNAENVYDIKDQFMTLKSEVLKTENWFFLFQ